MNAVSIASTLCPVTRPLTLVSLYCGSHVGDLGNLETDDDGNIRSEFDDTQVSLVGPMSVIGRSFVVSDQSACSARIFMHLSSAVGGEVCVCGGGGGGGSGENWSGSYAEIR